MKPDTEIAPPPPPLKFQKKTKVDTDPQGSKHRGFAGFFESVFRKFKNFMHIFMLTPMYALGALCIGLALVPGIFFFNTVNAATQSWPALAHYAALGFALGAGYFLYGFSQLFVLPTLNFVLRGQLKPWRGTYYSLGTIKWYIHNSLTYLMRYTFLEFFTPTPFNLLFYKWMGMKIGRGTQINSTAISDPSLIELGEKVTIGGGAVICAHYGMAGFLIIAPVKIGDNAVVGLRAIVMGGVEIGAGAKVLPNSVVLPKTFIAAGETWGGVPAVKIDVAELKKIPQVPETTEVAEIKEAA